MSFLGPLGFFLLLKTWTFTAKRGCKILLFGRQDARTHTQYQSSVGIADTCMNIRKNMIGATFK